MLEVIEEILVKGNKRYRIRLVNTNITFNVSASSPEDAVERATELALKLGVVATKKGE
ncbi:MAG: hypothetical protein QXF82_08330 [Nitrososphaeria archaeon]